MRQTRRMESIAFGLEDHDFLILFGLVDEDALRGDEGAPVLGGLADLLSKIFVDGALLGTVGNSTYDGLKLVREELRRRRVLAHEPASGIEEVQKRITKALADAGHSGPLFEEITRPDDQGWHARGRIAGGRTFECRTDADAQVVHLRVT